MHLAGSFAALTIFSAPLVLSAQIPAMESGVPVHQYRKGSAPEADWSVGPPVLVIGSERRKPEIFFDVAGVLSIAGARLLVADGGSSELRFFDMKTGRHLYTVGGKGRGPGEFDGLWDVWQTNNGIVAVDASGRASYFDLEGTFLRTLPPPVSGLGRRLRRAGFFADGTTLAYGVEPDSDVKPDEKSVVWMRIEMLEEDEPSFLLRYPHHIATRKGPARPWGLVYGPVSALAAAGTRFCVGFPAEYVIDCFSLDGARPLHRIVRESWARVPVGPAHRVEYFEVNEAANPGARGAPYLEYLRENAQFADEFPAFERLVSGDNGDLWVGPFIPEGDTPVLKPSPDHATTWSVYSADGRWLSDVVLPARFRLFSAGSDYVAGVARDENDVESVVILPLRKR